MLNDFSRVWIDSKMGSLSLSLTFFKPTALVKVVLGEGMTENLGEGFVLSFIRMLIVSLHTGHS